MKSLMRRISSGPANEELPIKVKGSLINDVETVWKQSEELENSEFRV